MDAVAVVGAVLGLSTAEQDEVWARWRHGESLRLVARRLGKPGPSVRALVQTGGVQPHLPPSPRRWLSMAEREEISRGVAAGEPCRHIAARLGRAPINGVVGAGQQRRPWPVSGPGRRRRRLPLGPAAQPAKLVPQPRLRTVWYPCGKRLPQGRGQLRDPLHSSQRPRGGRPGGARALARRPGLGPAAQRGRDPGGTPPPRSGAVPPWRTDSRPSPWARH
jgi:Helix-turn-helix domain